MQDAIKQSFIGAKVIIRTRWAGVWFGTLDEKAGREVILSGARRMCRWRAVKGISLSGVANHGIVHDVSRIEGPIPMVWLEAIEIIPVTEKCRESLEGAPHVVTR